MFCFQWFRSLQLANIVGAPSNARLWANYNEHSSYRIELDPYPLTVLDRATMATTSRSATLHLDALEPGEELAFSSELLLNGIPGVHLLYTSVWYFLFYISYYYSVQCVISIRVNNNILFFYSLQLLLRNSIPGVFVVYSVVVYFVLLFPVCIKYAYKYIYIYIYIYIFIFISFQSVLVCY